MTLLLSALSFPKVLNATCTRCMSCGARRSCCVVHVAVCCKANAARYVIHFTRLHGCILDGCMLTLNAARGTVRMVRLHVASQAVVPLHVHLWPSRLKGSAHSWEWLGMAGKVCDFVCCAVGADLYVSKGCAALQRNLARIKHLRPTVYVPTDGSNAEVLGERARGRWKPWDACDGSHGAFISWRGHSAVTEGHSLPIHADDGR